MASPDIGVRTNLSFSTGKAEMMSGIDNYLYLSRDVCNGLIHKCTFHSCLIMLPDKSIQLFSLNHLCNSQILISFGP